MAEEELSFWEHLDVFRNCLIKVICVTVVAGIVAFCLKEQLFDIVLAPKDAHFITYKLLGTDDFSIHLVNVGLTEQFMVHMKTALCFGVLVALPYVLYELYGFVSPALYQQERRYSARVVMAGYLLFCVGILINYFLFFPLTVKFLATYQVSSDVENLLSLQSYIDTLLMMSFVFGLVFEIPVVSWLMAKLGVLRSSWMRHYRRHAVVVILIVAAIITPTSDIFTLSIVAVPIWLLYEISIFLVQGVEGPEVEEDAVDEEVEDTI
ncbi:twin arginine-targeting protein translocase TatC [Prevotella sp. DNF00663]|uniref:twin-arginine translocase subunit TatC n=1 Tax=Prevotella sp. DNF00663 TaxID=1384078 RepID=UPI000784E43E|nr:twin-arginine translocase subunit TatC [Prevotella sp. DNF00663]KXB84058.1 twin arginine-targeting protein translocase TatC [Prevotella sp. DNF00663]